MEENLIILLWRVLVLQNMTEKYQEMLGGTGSGKTTLVQEMARNSMFGKRRGVHWISKFKLSKQREAEIDSCFTSRVEFYSPQDEDDLQKTFDDLENIERERIEKS